MGDKSVLYPAIPQQVGRPTLDPEARRSPFGRWLRGMLKARRMTQAELAERVGMGQPDVSHWTFDRIPTVESCRAIALAFGVPASEVLVIAGHLAEAADYGATHPTRARLHALIDRLAPEILDPHLAILERTAALVDLTEPEGDDRD